MQQLDSDYMTVAETAKYLKVHPKTVLSMLKGGRLEGQQLGLGRNSRYRVSAASIERLLSTHLRSI
jgi:excisionase family DNA binding protein